MNFKVILCALIVIELVQLIDAKRSFGLTSRRSKSKSPSVRRGQHGHDGDDHAPIPKPPAPSNAQKNIGWNTQQAHNTHNAPSAPPSGPITASHVPQGGLYSGNTAHQPPPYGMHHGSSYGGAPPAYNPHHSPPAYGAAPAYGGAPPAYSPGGFNQPRQAYGNSYGSPPMGASPYGQNMHYGNNQMMGGSPMMAGGGGMMGGNQMMGMPMMGVMPMQSQSRGSGLGSGLMTNLFAGLAGYQIAKAFSGGSHGSGAYNNQQRERDVIIINNPPAQQVLAADGTTVIQPAAPVSNAYPHTPLNPPPVSSVASVPAISSDPAAILSPPDESPKTPLDTIPEAAEASLPQLVPTNNEYNHWGLPQYGIPLYGYNLPSQITEYYQIDTIKLNHDSQQQQQAEQTTTSSAASS